MRYAASTIAIYYVPLLTDITRGLHMQIHGHLNAELEKCTFPFPFPTNELPPVVAVLPILVVLFSIRPLVCPCRPFSPSTSLSGSGTFDLPNTSRKSRKRTATDLNPLSPRPVNFTISVCLAHECSCSRMLVGWRNVWAQHEVVSASASTWLRADAYLTDSRCWQLFIEAKDADRLARLLRSLSKQSMKVFLQRCENL